MYFKNQQRIVTESLNGPGATSTVLLLYIGVYHARHLLTTHDKYRVEMTGNDRIS